MSNPERRTPVSKEYKLGYNRALEEHGLGPNASPDTLVAAPGYSRLVQVFKAAHHQAAFGKGLERHANSDPFELQRMISISKLINSPDGMAYQVIKKLTEGLAFEEHHRILAELYGALNYLAGIVVYIEDTQGPPMMAMAAGGDSAEMDDPLHLPCTTYTDNHHWRPLGGGAGFRCDCGATCQHADTLR